MSFVKKPHGKDGDTRPGIELDGVFYTNLDLIEALARALINKGVVSKQEIKDELP